MMLQRQANAAPNSEVREHMRRMANTMSEPSENQSDRPQPDAAYSGGAGEILPRLVGLAALVLAAVFAAQIIFEAPLPARLGVLALEGVLLVTWVLVRTGHLHAASLFFPSAGWVVANLTLFTSGFAEPMMLAAVNAVVTLIAAALLGPSAVLPLVALTILLGTTLAVLDVSGLAGTEHLPSIRPVIWVTGGGAYALISWFGFYALRQQHLAAEEAQRRTEQLSTLTAAAAAITASLERDETIQHILEQLERVVPYDSASVQVLHDGHLEIVGGRGWQDKDPLVGIRFPMPADNPNTVVIETRQPHILDDAPSAHAPFREPPHDHIRSWLGVPLILGDRVMGMLSVDSTQPARYDESHARVAAAFADHVAIALENARLFEAEQHRHRMTAIQQDITQVTSSTLDLDTVLERVARLTATATGADRCLILLRDENDGALKLASGQTGEEKMPAAELERLRRRGLTADDVFLSELTDSYQALRAGLHGGRELPAVWRDALGAHDALFAPLKTHQGLLGAMLLLHQEPSAAFTEDQINLAQTVAVSVSASVENALLHAQVEEMALTDSLTGLYNRRGLKQLAEREIEFVRRYQRPLSVLMLDLDHFKRLNDSHGHNIGDEVLVGLADRLRATLRNVDTISRHGGEEFVVLLPECDLASAQDTAERVRSAVEARPFATEAGQFEVTVSVGVTSATDSSEGLAVLVDRADQAMYAAKQAGRNQVWSWTPEQPEPSSAV